MAYEEAQAQRIREVLLKLTPFEEKKMMGGLCFFVDEKMLCGIHIDKASNSHFLMARVGPECAEKILEEAHVRPMNFTGRSMKGYVFIEEEGFANDPSLEQWIGYCLEFNPLAKSSKRKKST